MYINTGQFGEEQKQQPNVKKQPGFFKNSKPAITPKKSADDSKVLQEIIRPEQDAKLLARKKYRPTNPQVKLLKTKFLNKKYEWQIESLEANLRKLKDKVKSTGLYADMLKQYLALNPSDRRFVHTWIKTHENSIRKFKSGKELEQKSEELQRALDLIEARLDYWKNLKDLESKGVDVRGDLVFKHVKPAEGKRIESQVYETPDVMPDFRPDSEKTAVDKTVKKVKRIMNLGDADTGKLLLSPIVPKDKRKKVASTIKERMFDVGKFAESRPGQKHFEKIKKEIRDKETLSTKKSKLTVDSFWDKKEIKSLQKEIFKVKKHEIKLKDKIKELLEKIKKKGDKATKLDTAVLGILLAAKPESFVATPTLMQGLKGVFSRLTDIEKKSIEEEANKYLDTYANKSEVLLKQLEEKEKELKALRGELPKIEAPTSNLGNLSAAKVTKDSSVSTFITVLPWLVAGFFIYKIYTGR